ncbi:MAG: hypothetical protein WC616_01495 [Candidatus Omnitrophota bacterium]
MEKKKDLPYMPFYVGDWRKAPDVRSLSLEERGLWFEMLCLMWESPRRGYLTIDGKTSIDDKTLSRMVGEDIFVITKIKQVLERCNVYSIEEGTGIIYNRRIVRDEAIKISRSAAGVLGMKSRYKKKVCYNKSNNKDINKGITNADIDIDIDIDIKDSKKEKKNKYLDFILLTEFEHQELIEKLGVEKVASMITRLNGYIGQIGEKAAKKRFTSHYHTILNWVRKDEEDAPAPRGQYIMTFDEAVEEERQNEINRKNAGISDE